MRYPILLFAALAPGGCGDPRPLPMAATPESSREALVAALDAWKQGKTRDQIASGTPPVVVHDDDLNRGARLVDYKIEGVGQARGTAYSYVVSLTLGGKDKPRRVYYAVVSEPRRAVTREDRSP